MGTKLTPKSVQIKPYEKNAKKHPDAQLKQIALSLKEYGWRQPIVVDKQGTIIVGHGRYMAYKKYPAGLKNPWIVTADDLSPEQVRGYRLMDNKTNESDWDMGLAIDELKELNGLGFDITLTGFDEDLLIEADEKDDAIPENAPTRANLGDIWQLGEHRVMCGDSTSAVTVEGLMDGKKADMVFTDPPYGVSYDGGHANDKRRDKLIGDESDSLYAPACVSAFEATKSGAAFYLWHAGVKGFQAAAAAAAAAAGWEIRSELIWNKNLAQFGAIGAQYKQKHEPFYYCFKKGKAPQWNGPNNEVTVWDCARTSKNEFHPTQKPVELATRAMANSSKSEDIVLDLFLGSGSTLIAAEKTGRICYGMELDPKYVDVILKRWEDYTGKSAILQL